ncbi:MAG: FAD-dependent blue-light sensor [Rhodobacteraceae bacterium HLUCCA08]|nr:MAG: FAD-dependent blue-light sensor [Rhodobacteraceae bacterium HLUCCA08]
MLRIVYTSACSARFDDTDIVDILDTARRRNTADGIGGIMIFHEGRFLQALEGPEDAVLSCFGRISRDTRHRDMRILSQEDSDIRIFSNWSMGFAMPETLPHRLAAHVRGLPAIWTRLQEVRNLDIPAETRQLARMLRLFLMRFSDLQLELPLHCPDMPPQRPEAA